MSEPMENEPVSFEAANEDLQFFGDVPFGITVQLGERRMKIGDILQLQVGSVISLSKSAGENVDVLINGRLVAFGEVMELEGSTGIRISELNFSD